MRRAGVEPALLVSASGAYGVGSLSDQPKMSVLPKVGAQSCCGAGLGTSSLVSSVWSA